VHGAERSLCSPRSDSVLQSGEPAHRTAFGTLLTRKLGIGPRERVTILIRHIGAGDP